MRSTFLRGKIGLSWTWEEIQFMAKLKIDSKLFARAEKAAEVAGYTSVEEFVIHILEKEIAKYESSEVDDKVADRLRGLGYLE
jgi:hypothetical protein